MKRSTIVQKEVSSLSAINSQTFSYNQNTGQTPIVVVPRNPCLFHCCTNVPSGYSILFQKWNAKFDPPLRKEGLILCWPAWNRISHVVTKKAVTYNAPVANCPTSDNVMVKVDVSFNFQIGPDLENVETFVYTLGAGRLQELLQAETEEAIRTLVFGNPVLSIRDLREELSRSMHDALNRSVNQYGVTIRNIRITSTELPADLDKTLSETTGFKSKLIAETKTHEAMMQKLVDDEKQKNLSLEKQYERQCQEIEAECQKAIIDRKQFLVKATGKMDVAVTNAKAATQAMITQALAAKRDAATLAEKHMIEVTLKAEYEANEKIVAAKQKLATAKLDGESMVAIAKSKAQGIRAESEAEALASAQMEEARQHEIELQRLGIMRQLAGQGKMVITGKIGENILKFVAPGSESDKTHAFTTGEGK